MNKLTAKLFYKDRYVKVRLIDGDNRVKTYYALPQDNQIQIKEIKKAFEIQVDKIIYENGVPTLYYNFENPIPVSFHLQDDELQFSDMNPTKLYAGLENKLVAQFMSQFFKPDTLTPSLIIGIITLVLMLGGFAFVYVTLQDIIQAINSIWEF